MTPARRSPVAALAVGALLVLASVCTLALCSPTEAPSEGAPDQQALQVSPLFDFSLYQRLFGRNYGSYLETISRRVYFLANALKVYISGIAYRAYKQSYFLAINDLSDKGPRELALMENRVLSGETAGDKAETAGSGPETPAGPESLSNGEYAQLAELELERQLRATIDAAAGKNLLPAATAHEGLRRRKRATDTQRKRNKRRRSLTVAQMIKSNAPAVESPQVLAKLDRNPKSDNPNYDPFALEATTMGLSDKLESVQLWQMTPSKREMRVLEQKRQSAQPKKPKKVQPKPPAPRGEPERPAGAVGYLFNVLKTFGGQFLIAGESENFQDANVAFEGEQEKEEEEEEEELPDVMFADLRKTGCLFEPRSQGLCGSCYIFAGITMAEYYFCKKTGHLVAFSEQYMVDCGKGRFHMMNGCGGGIPGNTPNFIQNFGLELRQHYPYFAREFQCPYEEHADLKSTGFIRMPIDSVLFVHPASWEELLKHTPIYVAVATPKDFSQYGGGVYDGQTCRERNSHAMVVVGHGREDGQEFWLVRNSHGPNWGDKGHWKIAKTMLERCIDQTGYIYSTMDGENFSMKPVVNEANTPVVTKKLVPRAPPRTDIDPDSLY